MFIEPHKPLSLSESDKAILESAIKSNASELVNMIRLIFVHGLKIIELQELQYQNIPGWYGALARSYVTILKLNQENNHTNIFKKAEDNIKDNHDKFVKSIIYDIMNDNPNKSENDFMRHYNKIVQIFPNMLSYLDINNYYIFIQKYTMFSI